MGGLPRHPSFKSRNKTCLLGYVRASPYFEKWTITPQYLLCLCEKWVAWLRHQTAGNDHKFQILTGVKGIVDSQWDIMSIFRTSYHFLSFSVQLRAFCIPYLQAHNAGQVHKARRHLSQSAWLTLWGGVMLVRHRTRADTSISDL